MRGSREKKCIVLTPTPTCPRRAVATQSGKGRALRNQKRRILKHRLVLKQGLRMPDEGPGTNFESRQLLQALERDLLVGR